jgi:hypothetical protein
VVKLEPTQSSKTSAFNTQTPGKYPEDNLSFQGLAVHPVYQNLNGSNAHFTDIYMNSIIPGFTLA